jgi:hypothetical protein
VRGASAVDEQARGPVLSCGYGGAAERLGLAREEGGVGLIGDEREGEKGKVSRLRLPRPINPRVRRPSLGRRMPTDQWVRRGAFRQRVLGSRRLGVRAAWGRSGLGMRSAGSNA